MSSTTTTTTTGLVAQVRRLLDQADAETVPSRLLAWWGNTDLPDGDANAPALTQAQWEATYRLIENAALDDDVVKPLAAIRAATRDKRPDGPLPIAIASFRAAMPLPEVARAVRAAAANGSDLRFPPANLADAIRERRVFAASALLHDQWGTAVPVHRGRDVTFVIDAAFYLTNPTAPWPDRCELDLGDGQGWRPTAFGEQLQAHYDQDGPEIAVRAHYGDEALTARFEVMVSDRPAPPEPDETWPLRAPATATVQSASGRAWVFRAPGRTELLNPVIIVEGFPGGHPCDYMYELLNQAGTVDALHSSGYDLVIVGLDNGLIPIQANAGVLVACIREARRRTRQPLVVGGVSMGGIIGRYALAHMESTGEPHGTGTYLSIDAPHGGTYTSLGVQWFVHALRPIARSLGGFAQLLDSPSNQQLMIAWLDGAGVVQSPLRAALLADLEAVGGYPRQPRKLAVSCGRGDGIGGAAAGTQTLGWSDSPFVSVTLNTLTGWPAPADADPPAEQYSFSELSLRRADGATIANLGQSRSGPVPDWYPVSGTTVTVDPGLYFLRWRDSSGVTAEQMVHAVHDWQTRVFLLEEGGDTRESGRHNVSVLMSQHGSQPDDSVLRAEEARAALADERKVASKSVNECVFAKFDNPMLGLFGAHLMLLARDAVRDARQAQGRRLPGAKRLRAPVDFDQSLFDQVVDNLRKLLGPDHPDVIALFTQTTGRALDVLPPVTVPPMLWRSWRLLIEASNISPALVPVDVWRRTIGLIQLRPFLVWAPGVDGGATASEREHELTRGLRELARPLKGGVGRRAAPGEQSPDETRRRLSLQFLVPRAAIDELLGDAPP